MPFVVVVEEGFQIKSCHYRVYLLNDFREMQMSFRWRQLQLSNQAIKFVEEKNGLDGFDKGLSKDRMGLYMVETDRGV